MTETYDCASRRRVLAGAVGVVGVATGLAGCGSGGGTGTTTGTGTGNGQPATVKVADVPVGGGTVITVAAVVVTQPVAGQFKAFSAMCTHQGCLVNAVDGGLITCPCHGSQYSIVDGSVKTAAPGLTLQTQQPLPAKTVTVSGTDLTVA